MGAGHFKINASFNKALFGFGDAVCVPAIPWIAEHYLNPLWKELDADKHGERSRRSASRNKAV